MVKITFSQSSALAACPNALNIASAVRAAEPIANHLPIAAVVFHALSNVSVTSLTFLSKPAISAIPHALSATGQYASTARLIHSVLSIPTAAMATQYNPAKWNAIPIATTIVSIGNTVDLYHTASHSMMLVAEPV